MVLSESRQSLAHGLQAQTAPDERVLWTGRPDPWTSFMSKWTALPFGLVWVGVMVALLVHVVRVTDMTAMSFALIFLGAGLYILMQPVAAFLEAKATLFAITDTRVLMLRKDGRHVRAIARRGIRHVELVRGLFGRGTLRIPLRAVDDGEGGKAVEYLEMHGLADAEQVLQMLSH